MSKFGEDSAPDIHGDDSYRAATNVIIQGKSLICWPTLEFSVTDFFLYSSVSPILQNEKLLVPERALETIVKNLILINHNCMIHGGRNGEVTMTNTDRVPPELPVQLRL